MALVIRALAGLLLWAAGFSLLYGLHGYGCAAGWGTQAVAGPFTLLNAALIGAWMMLLAAALGWALLVHAGRVPGNQPILLRVTEISAWVGLAGLLLTGAPVLLPAHCL
jgi:hypothetical protein